MAFYAYLILGFDYDSFGEMAGSEFFQKAETIVTNAQNSDQKGWKSFESSNRKNRYWIVNNLLNDKYHKIREFYYEYHRHGLDIMEDDLTKGRDNIAKSIELLRDVYRRKPDPYMHLLKIAVEAKADEIINIFSQGTSDEKSRVTRIMSEIDPANSSKYNKIKEQQ